MKKPKAMLLAAGRGERMRPLTDATPKPLLEIGGKPMIEWHLLALARAGIREVVINTAWLEAQFPAALGDGSRWNLHIRYSMEGREHGAALETAGGIATALPWLIEHPDDPFWVVSADIHAPDFRFDNDALRVMHDDPQRLAHLWLVDNPPFHRDGDFGIDAEGWGLADAAGPDQQRWTYSNLGLMRSSLVESVPAGSRAALGPLLFAGMRQQRISAEIYRGRWHNVGTPEQLAELNR